MIITALYLDSITKRYKRVQRRRTYLVIALLTGVFAIFGPRTYSLFAQEIIVRSLVVVCSFTFTAYIWKSLLEAMYLSLYRRAEVSGIDYWVEFIKQYGIWKLPFATEACLRLGISWDSIDKDLMLTGSGEDFATYITRVFTDNQSLRAILEKQGITKAHWVGAWSWCERREREMIERAYILDAEHMKYMPSIGEAFAFGQVYKLNRYGNELRAMTLSASVEHFYARTFALFQQSLKKSAGANIILIAQSIEEGVEYITAFIPHYPKKKYISLDTQSLLGIKDAELFQHVFGSLLRESVRAGNIVFVIPNIAALIAAGHTIGYDVALALSEYMQHPELHIVMITDRYQYHTTLETHISLVQASEKIELDALAPELLQTVAEEEVLSVEYRREVFFTYAAIAYIVESVIRYGSERMHDTLKDYLDECALYARSHKVAHGIITLALTQSFVGEKQGTEGTLVDTRSEVQRVPLQEVLSRRVKGQDAAIDAVARALDRVRAGLGSSKRPLGTFLFLGPTGVGKTEMAKALAEAYFSNEEKILRFDMSEFSDAGALNRLIGSFEIGEIGILAGKARDVEHGVILFDEIEKAHEKVRDLMLQILDEGYFTDARGGKVNMKNFIMIATSNAGSDEIYNGSMSGKLPDKTALIGHIIDQGIFRPEFINRFDEVAIFSPLGDQELAAIAEQKLLQYEARLYEKKAIHVNITPVLVAFIMNHIENKAFGGREITRTIQNYIESIIAKDLVDGTARAGTTVTLTYNNDEHRLMSNYK